MEVPRTRSWIGAAAEPMPQPQQQWIWATSWTYCDNLEQQWIFSPLSEARNWTRILMDTSQILNLLSHNRSSLGFVCLFCFLSSQARDQIWATVVTYIAAVATLDSLTHSAGPGIQPAGQMLLILLCHSRNASTGFLMWKLVGQVHWPWENSHMICVLSVSAMLINKNALVTESITPL